MSGFTKLFSSITSSSIWNEDDKTRLVWITMLAMSNANGVVSASVGGLAHVARVTREDCDKALEILLNPDPDSRSPEYEGRRIEKIDGGFLLLNYAKYREARSEDERRLYMREYMKGYRKQSVNKRKPLLTAVNHGKPPLAQAEAEAEHTHGHSADAPLSPFDIFWFAYPKKKAKGAAIKAFTKVDVDVSVLVSALEWQSKSLDWTKDGKRFIPHPATWLNERRWEDEDTEGEGGKGVPGTAGNPYL